ncbi:MAG: dihydrodipicolinate synthase family protein [Bacillota bacterium]
MAPEDVRKRIKGIVAGVPTLYDDRYRIDTAKIESHVDYVASQGIAVFMVSLGISEVALLTQTELEQVVKAVVSGARGRAIVLATTGMWWTGQAIEYARRLADSGADALIAFPFLYPYSDYVPASHDDTIYDFFVQVAEATSLPIVVHCKHLDGPTGRQIPWSASLLERVVSLERVVGMKEESLNRAFFYHVLRRYGERLAIVDDYGKESFLITCQMGASAYVSGICQFAPAVALSYLKALQDGDFCEASRIASQVVQPLEAKVAELGLGWVAGIKAYMEVCGLPRSPVRPPLTSATEGEKKVLRDMLKAVGLVGGQQLPGGGRY